MDHVTKERDGRTYLRVCRSVDVNTREGRRIDVDVLTSIAVFRVGDRVYATSNICPHKHANLIASGVVVDGTVRCPLHGWTFRISDGVAVEGTMTPLPTYDCFDDGQWVWVSVPIDEPL